MAIDNFTACIYCLLDFSTAELTAHKNKKADLFFALDLLDLNYMELLQAYESAVIDNETKHKEIANLRLELLTLSNSHYPRIN
jgi:hypothetical protein